MAGRWCPLTETRRLSRLGGCRLGNASIERLLGVGFHRSVRGGDGNAGEHEASAAGHLQINVLIRCRSKDRLIIGAVDGAVQAFVDIDEGDLVGGHGSRAGKVVQAGPIRSAACCGTLPQSQRRISI